LKPSCKNSKERVKVFFDLQEWRSYALRDVNKSTIHAFYTPHPNNI
jgi:hypothetical protein